MAQSNSSSTWQKKGFGWIPDLPDIADPSLTLALDNKPRILSREGTDYLEGIANILSKLLKDKNSDESKQLEEVYNQILGETRFPNVQVYKILRKLDSSQPAESAQIQQAQAKEILQLKQVLYWIYRGSKTYQSSDSKDSQSASSRASKDSLFFKEPDGLLPDKHESVIEWLQSPEFDGRLEEVVKDFQKQHQLVEDGIVGLRTYIALKDKLANPNERVKEQNVELLCPSSIIPHDILEEVFQQLTYIWLYTKFSFSIDQVFEYFFGQYHLSPSQNEYAIKIKVELQSTLRDNLKEMSLDFRKKIKLLPKKLSGQAKKLHEKAIEDLDLHEKAIDLVAHKEAIDSLYEEAIRDLIERKKSINNLYEEAIRDLIERKKSIEELDFYKESINDLYKKAIKSLDTREKADRDLVFYKKAIKDLREATEDLDFHTRAVEDLKKKLINLKDILVRKSNDLAIVAYQELDRHFPVDPLQKAEGYPDSQPVSPIFENLHKTLEANLNELEKSLCGKHAEKAVLDNSFVIYSDDDFIEQFHTWFHIIEPFVSAIFQILSPLASFDNYRQAVSTGFDKLDSYFHLHQLKYASGIASYKNLLIEYSSVHSTDQIEELQELRKTIFDLFQETIAKIDRIRRENLNYRHHILNTLEEILKININQLDKKLSGKDISVKKNALLEKWKNCAANINPSWLQRVWINFLPSIKGQLSRFEDEEDETNKQKRHIQSLAFLFIKARLSDLADSLSELPLSANLVEFVEYELAKDKQAVDLYFSFFDFLSDIVCEKYGVRLKNSNAGFIVPPSKPDNATDARKAHLTDPNLGDSAPGDEQEKDGIDLLSEVYEPFDGVEQGRSQAELVSFLTFKKELFEIQSVDNWNMDTIQPDPKVNKALFFEPTVVQLPINANLMKKAARPIGWAARPSDKTTASSEATRFYFFLPGLVDLSYWCPPIEDQENVNACTAFAGVSLLEYFAQKRYGKYTNLSARFLYKTARNLMNRSDDTGASVRQTMKALVLFGVPPKEVWPWNAENFNEEPPAFCYAYAQSYQALKYFRLDAAGSGAKDTSLTSRELLLFQIKAVLAAGLPCIFGFTIYSSFFKDRNIRFGYIPYPSSRDQIMGGHTAVAVGYNDHKRIDRIDGAPAKLGAILIRNSWGPSWGNGGYGWMPYEYILDGLTADWWSLLKAEWFDGGAFGLGAVDPGSNKPMGSQPVPTQPAPRRP